MAKKRTPAIQKYQRLDFKEITFVIDNLTKEQMTDYDQNLPAPDQLLNDLNSFAEEGAKVSIKFDSYNGGGYLATATFDLKGFHNAGYAISARGNDVLDAIGILAYKYFKIAERDLSLWDYGKEDGYRRG